jgi:CelD/BcsL family acetyltransferase involved in cellulose biosynthesis
MALEAREIRDVEEVRSDWEDIVERSRRATVFQTLDWTSSQIRHNLYSGEPLIIGFFVGDRLVGAAPLLRKGTGSAVKRLMLLGGDYHDLIADPDHEVPVLEAFSKWLENSRAWELCDFRSLHADSLLARYGEAGWPTLPFHYRSFQHQLYPVLELPNSREELEKKIGKNLRQEIRYIPRKLQRDFPEFHWRLADEATFEGDLNALFRLHQMRWSSKGMPGVFAEDWIADFHRSVAAGFFRRGRLSLYSALIGERHIASLYCWRQGDEMVYYLGGFDPEFSGYSPIKFLIGQAIFDAIESGARVFDFLKGEEDYKSRWRAENRPTHRLLISARGLRSKFVMTALELQPKIKALRRRG